MRILIASNVYPPHFVGGAELIAHQHAKALIAIGHEVEVFAGETQPFGAHHEIRHDVLDGVPVHRISMLPKDYQSDFINFSHPAIESHFRRVLEAFRPDVFHAHNLIGLSVSLPHLARQAGCAIVVTLHDHWGYCFKNTIIKEGLRICVDFTGCAECMATIDDGAARAIPIRLRKDFFALMLSDVDAFVSPSRYLANSYLKAGFPPEKLQVLWNGIDLARFRKVRREPSPGELRFTYVGILAHHKGVATLMVALSHLPPDSRVRVNIVGDGPERAAFEEILRVNGCADRVRFWGRVDSSEIEKVYAQTDVLILPSIWPENQPVSITEAMSCRIPAIVSAMGGMAELVEDGVSGDAYPAGDAQALADCMLRYADDPTRASRFGEAAYKRIAAHSFDKQVRQLVGFYDAARAAPSNIVIPEKLAICLGHRFGSTAARAIETLGANDGWRFVMGEWLTPGLARQASLAWVVDPDIAFDELPVGGFTGRPTLVDIHNEGMRSPAFKTGTALFYHAAEDAVGVVRNLDGDARLRAGFAQTCEPVPAGVQS